MKFIHCFLLTFLLVLALNIPSKCFSLSEPWYWQGDNIEFEGLTQTAKGPAMVARVAKGEDSKEVLLRPSVTKPLSEDAQSYYLTGWEFPLTEIQNQMHLKVGDEVGYFENGKTIWKTVRSFLLEPDELNGGYIIYPFLGDNPKPTNLVFLKEAFSSEDEYPLSVDMIPCVGKKMKRATGILKDRYAKGLLHSGKELLTADKMEDSKKSLFDFGAKNWKMTSDGRYVFADGPLPTSGFPRSGTFIVDGEEAYFLENESVHGTFYINKKLYFFESGCIPDTDGCWSGIIDWEGYKGLRRVKKGTRTGSRKWAE